MEDKLISISVRQATPEDAEAMLQIQHDCIEQIFHNVYTQTALNTWKHVLTIDKYIAKTQGSGWCFVAVLQEELSEQVVGFGCLNSDASQFPPLPKDYKYDVQIESVYVSVNHHKLGIGKKLMQELERKALNEGYTRAGMLSSLTALSFYERTGYSIVEKRWYNVNPNKPEVQFTDGIYSLETILMVKDLESKLKTDLLMT